MQRHIVTRAIGAILLLLGLALGGAAAQSRAETILLKNAIVHTVSGETLVQGSVLLNGRTIEKVVAAGDGAALKADKVIDLKGKHLFPGMIALDTALGLSEISGVRATRDLSEVGEFTPDVLSWIAVNPDSELIPVTRANGVAYFQPSPQGGAIAGQSGLLATDGSTMESMTVQKVSALHVYWPDMDLATTPKEELQEPSKWKSLEDQSKERQKKINAIGDFFDDARAYAKAKGAASKDAFAITPTWEAMLPYVRGERPLMIHADDIRQIKSAVNWARANQLKMILAGARDGWAVAEFLATNKVPVLYEHVFTQPPTDHDAYDIQFKAPELMRQAGIKVATGMGATAFDAALIKNLPYQAAQAVAFGFPRDEALRSITLYPAELLGVADRFGSIEPGKEATLFVASGDILDIRSNVERMWIAGKEVSLETRHTRLYEKYKGRRIAQ